MAVILGIATMVLSVTVSALSNRRKGGAR
jgi:hypothetical protein